jgi:hypothetical protein
LARHYPVRPGDYHGNADLFLTGSIIKRKEEECAFSTIKRPVRFI